MKKALAGTLVLLLALLALAGCGGAAPSGAAPAVTAAPAPASEADASAPAAAASDWAYIEQKGEMIIGITYFEPMNYLDDAGEVTGFETEFAKAVCEILGVTPVFQEINWQAKETELSAKNIDCIWNGMTIDAERAADMSISQPYMRNRQVLLVKSENVGAMAASVEGMSIVAEAGSAGETVCQAEDFFAGAAYTPVDSQAKGLMEVAAGTADGCVVDYVLSIGMIGEGTDYADLAVADTTGYGAEEYGIAMRKSDTEFTQKVNDAINELIGSGALDEIAGKYKLADLLIK